MTGGRQTTHGDRTQTMTKKRKPTERRGTGPDGHAANAARSRDAGEDAAEHDALEGAAVEDEITELRGQLEILNGKRLRALADLDNYKKRVERDRGRWSEAAREEILLDLLEVVDNFERALACENEDSRPEDDAFRQGVELILKHLADVLRKHGVTPIVTDGCEFDPNVHEAVGHIDSAECEANHVVDETQRGYMLGDRLLRCSKVIVAK